MVFVFKMSCWDFQGLWGQFPLSIPLRLCLLFPLLIHVFCGVSQISCTSLTDLKKWRLNVNLHVKVTGENALILWGTSLLWRILWTPSFFEEWTIWAEARPRSGKAAMVCCWFLGFLMTKQGYKVPVIVLNLLLSQDFLKRKTFFCCIFSNFTCLGLFSVTWNIWEMHVWAFPVIYSYY